MSRSKLQDKWMRENWTKTAKRMHIKTKNPHRQDEAPKNKPSKYILTHCSADVAWLQESTSFGGHSIPKGGHRRVSGIVRANVKKEIRKQIQEELNDTHI